MEQPSPEKYITPTMQAFGCEPEGSEVKCSVCGKFQTVKETNEFSDGLTYTTQYVAYDAVDKQYICQKCAHGIFVAEAMKDDEQTRVWLQNKNFTVFNQTFYDKFIDYKTVKDIGDASGAGCLVYTLNSFLKQLQAVDDAGKFEMCENLNGILSRS